MALSRRQKLTIISLLLYWPIIFILTHVPIPQLVRQAGVSDKYLHFIAFLFLIFLLWFAVSPDRKVSWREPTVWWVLFVVAGYGAFDEWLQDYFVGRSGNVADFLANLAGTFAGLILLVFLTFWPALLVVTGITIFLLTNLTRVNLANFAPKIDITFHLFAYAVFTILWIQYMWFFLLLKAPKAKWLILTLALPIGLLSAVKSFSLISDRSFGLQGIIASIIGIVAVAVTIYVIALFRQRVTEKLSPGDG
jgi:VanZ family protein